MTANAGSRERQWRFKLQSSITLFVAIVGVATGVILVYFDYRNSGELRAYRSAATCATASAALTADSCRYTGLATVTASSQQTTLSVSLSFPSLPGHSFVATFPSDREPGAASIGTGATAPAVLWNGEVTEFAGVTSVQDPEYLPSNLAGSGWIMVVIGLGLAAWAVTLVRQAWSH